MKHCICSEDVNTEIQVDRQKAFNRVRNKSMAKTIESLEQAKWI